MIGSPSAVTSCAGGEVSTVFREVPCISVCGVGELQSGVMVVGPGDMVITESGLPELNGWGLEVTSGFLGVEPVVTVGLVVVFLGLTAVTLDHTGPANVVTFVTGGLVLLGGSVVVVFEFVSEVATVFVPRGAVVSLLATLVDDTLANMMVVSMLERGEPLVTKIELTAVPGELTLDLGGVVDSEAG